MAYTIVKSDGTLLTTIPDGTINTTSTSVGLPGRNYAGYGQTLDTNFVHMLENFADNAPPQNPMKGQLWYDINTDTLKVCPSAGESNALAWLSLTSTSAGGNTTFGNVTVNGTIASNDATIVNNITAASGTFTNLQVTGNLATTVLTTGGNTVSGSITGNWLLTAGSRLQATYADLAERFESDEVLEAGTVVEIGGTKEITAVKYELSEDVFGVVSNTAAYLMNAAAGDDISHPAVAVSGRVQVKTIGKVKKGERLVSAGNGYARAARTGEANAFNTIGRALCDKVNDGLGLVEAIVIIR
jgi:hypothetical protein